MILFREQLKKYFELAISYTDAHSAPTKLVPKKTARGYSPKKNLHECIVSIGRWHTTSCSRVRTTLEHGLSESHGIRKLNKQTRARSYTATVHPSFLLTKTCTAQKNYKKKSFFYLFINAAATADSIQHSYSSVARWRWIPSYN